ncbi:MAG: DUF4838 domain-containing protein [Anaerolineae bacterium]
MSQHSLTIRVLSNKQPLLFAAAELVKYIQMMTGNAVKPTITTSLDYEPDLENSLWLAEASQAPTGLQKLAQSLPAVANPQWDDAFAAEVEAGEGVILGNNPRSVLIGAYNLLIATGCRWVRPGTDGEVIPQRDLCALSLHKTEAASYRHRGICIEGACSYENIADIIDWAPKVGYNSYFTQFRESYTFFERWYSHRGNPNRSPEPLTVEIVRDFLHRAQDEIAKRGLVYHAVGHGWTCEPLGIAGLGWESQEYQLPPETQAMLAEVNGVRAVWRGVPLNTNLCYSNPQVRRLVNESIADYAAANPIVDVLHFWLADGSNNHCECEQCRQAPPSDFYVQMLNELDELLTARNIATRVVFLIYVDLLWPPEKQKLVNQERFILMFAPITRSYSQPFTVDGDLPNLPAYNRNKLKFPANVAENVAFLRSWQQGFTGDSFDFDYHLMWDHFNDPSYTSTARILGEDVKRLKAIGLNGYMSCQLQRIFFPTSLPMVVLGRTLWDDTLDQQAISDDYYLASFGTDGVRVARYLAELSTLFCPPYLRGERPAIDAEVAVGLAKINEHVQAFMPVIQAHQATSTGALAKSWEYLALHAEYCQKLALALLARANGGQEAAKAGWQSVVQYVWANEPALQPVFDVFLCVGTLNRRFA